mmetsp:Transcript_32930/g.79676  ORF Transcript_32930/g.79676 Transcript_32930/m.79676 type:complete len:139 (+) Transcript_32930:338-754(+)
MMFTSIFRASAAAARISQRRTLSTTCSQSLSRLNEILEDYRASHYAQELPKRFRKDIVNVASKGSASSQLISSSPGGIVSAAGIEQVLNNIGAGDQMSHDEIETMLREIGSDGMNSSVDGGKDCVITADKMLDLLSMR